MPASRNIQDPDVSPNVSVVEAIFVTAVNEHALRNFEAALEGYVQILEHNEQHAPTLVHVADIYLHYNRIDDARLVLTSLLENKEEALLTNIAGLPEPYLNVVDLCQDMNEFERADRILLAASEIWPECPDVHIAMAERLCATGNWKGAEAQLLQAVELIPDHADTWVGLADIRLEAGDLVGAVDAFVEALEIEPGNQGAVRQALAAIDQLNDASLAQRYRMDLIELIDDDVDALVFIGFNLLTDKDYRGALSAFARATDIDMASYEASIGAGAAAYHLGESSAANTYWSQGFEALPDDLETLLALVHSFAAALPVQVASQLLDAAAVKVFDDADRLCLVGQTARDIGMEDEATKLVRRAVALEPDNAFARGLLESEPT